MCLACCAFGFRIAIELRYLTMCKISSSLGWSNLLELFIVKEVFPGGINIHTTSTGSSLLFFPHGCHSTKKTPLPGGLHYRLAFHTPLHRFVIVCVCFAEAARHQAGRRTQI